MGTFFWRQVALGPRYPEYDDENIKLSGIIWWTVVHDYHRNHQGKKENIKISTKYNFNFQIRPDRKILTADEKTFLLNVERGDVAAVKRMVKAFGGKKQIFDINCTDPLGRCVLLKLGGIQK